MLRRKGAGREKRILGEMDAGRKQGAEEMGLLGEECWGNADAGKSRVRVKGSVRGGWRV